MEDFADVVDWSLDGLDPPRGGSNVSTSMGTGSRGSWPLESKMASSSWDPVTSWLLASASASGGWDTVTVSGPSPSSGAG
jgi:hypothetical protein